MTTRAAIVAEARSWVGTRYQHQGRLKGIGVDCVGLIGGVAIAAGVAEGAQWAQDRALAGYGRIPDPKVLLGGCERYLDRIERWQVGDVLVLSVTRDPCHFAIVSALDPPYIVHAYARSRKVVEARLDETWAGRVRGAYAFRGVH